MKILLKLIVVLFFGILNGCQAQNSPKLISNYDESNIKWSGKNKIKVLNMGTFHFGYTSDANKTEFDEHNTENKKQAHQIAKALSEFKPTVIIVERLPINNKKLQNLFTKYVKNPKLSFKHPTEIELIAFELGRLANTKRIYGIDSKMSYNYNIGNTLLENKVDPNGYKLFFKNPFRFRDKATQTKIKNKERLNLKEKLKEMNMNFYLDYLMTVNADILTTVGTENGFEGADEAAKFYKRNLRMFSNLNRIPLSENDKVFILMGASHTAFFRDFISRSLKFEMVNVLDYLK